MPCCLLQLVIVNLLQSPTQYPLNSPTRYMSLEPLCCLTRFGARLIQLQSQHHKQIFSIPKLSLSALSHA